MPWDTSLRSLRERMEKSQKAPNQLLEIESPSFAGLFAATPDLPAIRTRILRRILSRGAVYREEMNRLHAELIALYPDDDRLRRTCASLDRTLADNLRMLSDYFGVPRARPRTD